MWHGSRRQCKQKLSHITKFAITSPTLHTTVTVYQVQITVTVYLLPFIVLSFPYWLGQDTPVETRDPLTCYMHMYHLVVLPVMVGQTGLTCGLAHMYHCNWLCPVCHVLTM